MKRPLAAALIALAVRACFLIAVGPDPRYTMTADSIGYMADARNLAESRTFSQSAAPPLEPDTVRTPLYPAFLAAFKQRAAAVWAQAILGCAAAGLIAWTALVLWESETAALVAGLLAALDPILLLHGPLLLTETLFFYLFSAGLAALAIGLKKKSLAESVGAGVFFGLAALTRPVGLYYFLLAALVAAWALRRERVRAAWLAVFVAASSALPLAWMARNKAVSGVFTFCSIQGLNFAVRAASVEAEVKGISMGEAGADVEKLIALAHPGAFSSVQEESRFKGAWATAFIMAHPVGYARVMVKDIVKILGGHGMELFAWEILKDPRYDPLNTDAPSGRFSGTRALMARHRSLRVLIPLYVLALAVLYALSLAGFLEAWKKRRWAALLCLSVVVYFLGVTAGLGAYYRLRIPLLGTIYLLAGYGIVATGRSCAPTGARRGS